MTEIDLRGIFDDCYGGYQDFAAEISLRRDLATGRWTGDSVTFWKDGTMGWRYRTAAGQQNYGYDSLRDAVIRFSISLTTAQREGHEFCAHRLLDADYRQGINSDILYCKTVWRFFFSPENHGKIQRKCDALSMAFNGRIARGKG